MLDALEVQKVLSAWVPAFMVQSLKVVWEVVPGSAGGYSHLPV